MKISLSKINLINSKCKYCGSSVTSSTFDYYIYFDNNIKINKTSKILRNYKIMNCITKSLSFRTNSYKYNFVVMCSCNKTKWIIKYVDNKYLESYFNLNNCNKGFEIKQAQYS